MQLSQFIKDQYIQFSSIQDSALLEVTEKEAGICKSIYIVEELIHFFKKGETLDKTSDILPLQGIVLSSVLCINTILVY